MNYYNSLLVLFLGFGLMEIVSAVIAVVVLIVVAAIFLFFSSRKTTVPIKSAQAEVTLKTVSSQQTPEVFAPLLEVPSSQVAMEITQMSPNNMRDSELAKTSPNSINIKKMITAQERVETAQETASLRLPHMNWQAVGLSDVGKKRELNEDYWDKTELMLPTEQPCGVYILSDGMGGHEGGEIASRVTVEAIKTQFMTQPPQTLTEFETWLNQVAAHANEMVIAQQGNQGRADRMGATLVAALVANNKATIVNVGDSRAYLLNSTIKKLTRDHSLVERLVELGQITEDEARHHPQKNVIYSTMGDKDKIQIDVYHCPLQPGDRLLLCSDGLSGMVEDEDLLKLSLSHPEAAMACQVMINAANEAGGKDNITAVIVQMDE